MAKETNRPISCRAFNTVLEDLQLGHDDWRTEVISSHHRIFQPPKGWPECRQGWRWLIDEACSEIENAVKPDQGETITIVKIIEYAGLLQILWEGTLSARTVAEVERAIEWAITRSAETCEVCGLPGRLYRCNGMPLTACAAHGKGKPSRTRSRFDRIVCGTIDGQDCVLSCREHDPECNAFVDIPPESVEGLTLGE